jgi:hypothetical protein
MILIVLLVLAVIVLAAVVIAFGFPASEPGKWIAQAFRDVYTFAYTELGTVLNLLKTPDGKFSTKRLIAVGLPAASWTFIGVPKDLYQLVVMVVAFLVAGGLMVLAELTKT